MTFWWYHILLVCVKMGIVNILIKELINYICRRYWISNIKLWIFFYLQHKQLSFILENLKKNGFKVKISLQKREKDNCKPFYQLRVIGGHKDRAKLYNKLLPFIKIKHKIEGMKNTIKYNEISNMIDRRKNEVE